MTETQPKGGQRWTGTAWEPQRYQTPSVKLNRL